jgi:hypothetical protein
VYAALGDVLEARDSILLLEFTAVPVGRVRHDQAADKKTVSRGVAWTTHTHPYDVFLFRVAQHARPAAIPAHLPHPLSSSNVLSECRQQMFGVQGKRARREEKLNLEREKLNLWGGGRQRPHAHDVGAEPAASGFGPIAVALQKA